MVILLVEVNKMEKSGKRRNGRKVKKNKKGQTLNQ
jgi:hypothetical protein